MLSIHKLSHHIHNRCLFQDLCLEAHLGEIVGIFGSNGSGKSTLLHTIASIKEVSRNTSFLSQENDDEHQNILEVALKYQTHLSLEKDALSLYADKGDFEFESKLQKQLKGISLSSSMKEFSLGQRQWIRLMSLLQSSSEILLLDEPTNYLDLEHVHLFKQKLLARKQKKIILMVTHDRYLLDELVDKILHLGPEGWKLVDGGYTSFIDYEKVQTTTKVNLSNKLQKQISYLNQESIRKKIWAGKAEKEKQGAFDKGFIGAKAARIAKKAVQAENRRLQKLEELKKAKPFIRKKLVLENDDYIVRLKEAVKVENLSKKYNEVLFSNLSFSLQSLDRIALCGPNGCGKSSLIRCLIGLDKNYLGRITWNPYLKWHYLPQGLENYFKGSSLSEHFYFLGFDLKQTRKMLGNLMLRDSIWEQKINLLSLGEKMRAALVEVMIMRAEFLILDEPTSHLDIESLEILDQFLYSFPGGFLFVSHDQTFLDRHADNMPINFV